jgi:hypothetical protein
MEQKHAKRAAQHQQQQHQHQHQHQQHQLRLRLRPPSALPWGTSRPATPLDKQQRELVSPASSLTSLADRFERAGLTTPTACAEDVEADWQRDLAMLMQQNNSSDM